MQLTVKKSGEIKVHAACDVLCGQCKTIYSIPGARSVKHATGILRGSGWKLTRGKGWIDPGCWPLYLEDDKKESKKKGSITIRTKCEVNCGRCQAIFEIGGATSWRQANRVLKESGWHMTEQRGWVSPDCWNAHWRELRGRKPKEESS